MIAPPSLNDLAAEIFFCPLKIWARNCRRYDWAAFPGWILIIAIEDRDWEIHFGVRSTLGILLLKSFSRMFRIRVNRAINLERLI